MSRPRDVRHAKRLTNRRGKSSDFLYRPRPLALALLRELGVEVSEKNEWRVRTAILKARKRR